MAEDGATHTSWTMAGINTSVDLDGGVLVGDDGSHAAFEAMRYAAAEAARRGTDLHVLRAWTIPTAVRPDDVPCGVKIGRASCRERDSVECVAVGRQQV